MGTWDSTIFGDDVACDVRNDFVELLRGGASPVDATKALVESWAESLDDADDGPVFWLALAATQWKYGCFLPDVQAKAIQVIDSGAALSRWEGRAVDTRRRSLSALRVTLLSPQPKARRPRKPKAIVVPSTKVPSPDGRALATAYEMPGRPRPGAALMQVTVEMDSSEGRGGGGVFVGDCDFREVALDWKNPDTLQITYPVSTNVVDRKPSLFFSGRTVQILYRTGAV